MDVSEDITKACEQDAPDEVLIAPPSPERLLPWLAALSSAGFHYRLVCDDGDWRIFVAPGDADAVRAELAEVERLNSQWPPVFVLPPDSAPLSDETVACAFAACVGLLMFYWTTGPVDAGVRFFAQGSADSAKILAGEWWRTVTAVTLHADLPHVLGNAVCCFFFGMAAARQVGNGAGWSLILATGVAANAMTAFLAGPGRRSIGASTATFGALGLLSVLQFVRNYRSYGKLRSVWNRTWLPLVAATALLAILGSGPGGNVDVLGHVLGFVAGIALGIGPALAAPKRLPVWGQILAGSCAVVVVYAAWFFALS